MEKVIKVMMFVYRQHNGQKQFFVLHRKSGDNVTLTGHVGDHIPSETLEEAVRREVKEELGVDNILSLLPLGYTTSVQIQRDTVESTEHAYLIEIPDTDVRFLEGDESHQWHTADELSTELTYNSQKAAVPKIKELL